MVPAALAAHQHGEGRHLLLCLSLPLPRDMPWLPGTVAVWQDGAGITLPGLPCSLHPQAMACRAVQDGYVPAETHQLIAPRASRELGRTRWVRFPLGSVGVPSTKPARVLPLGQAALIAGSCFSCNRDEAVAGSAAGAQDASTDQPKQCWSGKQQALPALHAPLQHPRAARGCQKWRSGETKA